MNGTHVTGNVPGRTTLPAKVVVTVARGQSTMDLDATDGRRLEDYLLGSAPMVLGHVHPKVASEVSAQLAKGYIGKKGGFSSVMSSVHNEIATTQPDVMEVLPESFYVARARALRKGLPRSVLSYILSNPRIGFPIDD